MRLVSNDLIIGTLLSFPIAVVGGLLVKPIERRIKNWGKSWDEARRAQLTKNYRQALTYVANPEDFTHYMLKSIMQTVLAVGAFIIGGALGLLSIFAVAYARKTGKIPMHDPSIWILVTYGAAGIIVNLIGAGYLSFSLSSVLPLWHRVFYFHKYAKGLPDDVRDKGAEKLAHEMRPYS
jgi:hypothetical protein